MAFIKSDGIVLRSTSYKDNDRMVVLFTRTYGRIDARVRGCMRPKSPLLSAGRLFSFGEFTLYESRERYSVDQFDLRESFASVAEDALRFSCASAMQALCLAAAMPLEPNERLFSLFYYALSFLCYVDMNPIDVTLCFLIRYLDLIGFCPSLTSCAVCGQSLFPPQTRRFAPTKGGACCNDCAPRARTVSALELEAMRRMLALEDREMIRVRLPDATRQTLLTMLTSYCEYHLERPEAPFLLLTKLLQKIDRNDV